MDQQRVEWRAIPGVAYEVSSDGRVRNAVTQRVLKPMRTGTRRMGSQRSKVRFSTVPRDDRDVAHLVLEAFVGPRPEGHVAMHLDDDSANNRVRNLRWGTHSDNMRDSVRKQRSSQQKLSPRAALAVRMMREAGAPGVSVAAMYGISMQRVCDIFKGRVAVIGKE